MLPFVLYFQLGECDYLGGFLAYFHISQNKAFRDEANSRVLIRESHSGTSRLVIRTSLVSIPSNSIVFRDQTYLKMALILEGCRGQNKMTKVDSGASDIIISQLEDYLIKVFICGIQFFLYFVQKNLFAIN